MKLRRGVSLIELLLVMSATSIILTMSAGLIHRILHAHSRAQSFVDVERTSLRLANTFRSDIHHANAATVSGGNSDDGVFLQLQLPRNQKIEYRRDEDAVLRIVLDGSQRLSREAFAFPPGIELSARKDDSRVVVLSIRSRPGELPTEGGRYERSEFAVPVALHVEVAPGREMP